MDDEYSALMRNNTWQLVELPPSRVPIGSKWVFRTKYNLDGSLQKYKARLVAWGFSQRPGFDFTEAFSPVVKPTSIRVILSLEISQSWPIRQLGVNNAFLNGDLMEDVYMTQPKGYEVGDGSLVCKFTKVLYGLKQALGLGSISCPLLSLILDSNLLSLILLFLLESLLPPQPILMTL